jgi:hypothetical protein
MFGDAITGFGESLLRGVVFWSRSGLAFSLGGVVFA